MSAALGVNFIHRLHVKKAAEEFSEERSRPDFYYEFYPHFRRQLLTLIANLMKYKIIITLLDSYYICMMHVILCIVCWY